MGGYLTSFPAAVPFLARGRFDFLRFTAALLLAGATSLVAASPPDWLRPLLAEDVSAWKDRHAAVCLLDFQRAHYGADDRVVELHRTAVRILSEAGRGEAAQSFSYNPDTSKVRTIRAWVVSADGKKTRAFGRGDFVDQVAQISSRFWNSQRRLHLNGATAEIEVGGVIAYEFELADDVGLSDASWYFLHHLPVVRSVFEVVPANGGRIEWHASSAAIPAPVAGSGSGALRWQMERLEPVPANRPARFLPNPLRVSARGVPAGAAARRYATWEEFSRAAAEIVEPRMEVTAAVAAKAAELTAGRATRWDRVRALCDFVQRDIAYLSVTLDKDSLAGYRPHPAAECLGNRYGDCKDKAALLCAMLRSLGDHGFLMLVYSGNPKVVPPDWPSACFNHAIVAIPADADTPAHWPVVEVPGAGRQVIFDATDPITPLGVLSDGDQGGHALVAAPAGAGLVQLPGETHPTLGIRRELTAILAPNGLIQVRGSETLRGALGAERQAMRTALREEKFGQAIETVVKSAVPLAREFRWTDAWQAATAEHRATVQFSADRYLRALGKERVMFNPLILAALPPLEPWKVAHEGTTWFDGYRLHETVRVTLPDGFEVEELPKAVAIEQPLASCRVASRLEGRDVVTEREVVRRPRFYDQADYEALRVLTQKIQETERRPVILKRAPAAAGVGAVAPAPRP